jgi:hypothetical protein
MTRLGAALRRPWEADGLKVDPKPADLLPKLPNEWELKLVDEAKHSSLLYECRCVLVHEYRKPGHGFDFDRRYLSPYYHAVQGSSGKETIELVYPTAWFLNLLPPILDSLGAYYIANGHDPYDSYEFGSPWRKSTKKGLG